jgi:hypothetical protein
VSVKSAMSISNRVCGINENAVVLRGVGAPQPYAVYQYRPMYVGTGGLIPAMRHVIDHGKSALYGGSAKEHELIRLIKNELMLLTKSFAQDVKSGAHVAKIFHLISIMEEFENEHAVNSHVPVPFAVVVDPNHP